jgi:tetratricopeptide (TPR) repeat protein
MLHLAAGFTFGQTGELSKAERIKKSRSYLKYAVECIQNDSSESALQVLDSILALDKNNPDAYYYKGLIHLHKGDSALAIEELSTGTSVAPLASRTKLLLAQVYLVSGNVGEAQILIDEVLAIKPSEGEALYLKGLSLLAVQDTAAALDKLEQAIEVGLSKAQR